MESGSALTFGLVGGGACDSRLGDAYPDPDHPGVVRVGWARIGHFAGCAKRNACYCRAVHTERRRLRLSAQHFGVQPWEFPG